MAAPTYEQVLQALQAADAAGNVEDARQLAQMAASMMPTTQAASKQSTEQTAGGLTGVARGLAGLADVTVGGVIPTAVGMVSYPFARVGRSPEEAQAISQRLTTTVDKPFGKAFGVTDTPEYQGEAVTQAMSFIGENFNKGAEWIAKKLDIPTADVENMMGWLSVGAPAVVKPLAKPVKQALSSTAEQVKAGVTAPFEKQLAARAERLSLKDYERGPQIDAAAEAQRLGIAISPENIQPTAGPKLTSAVAGGYGTKAIEEVNRTKVRSIALNEMDLPPTSDLSKPATFDMARAKVAKPYNEIKKLPTMVADETIINALNALKPEESLIGANTKAAATQGIIDDAIAKVSKGLDGQELLRNIQTLRKRASTTYKNKNADLPSLDFADANLAIANTLETMVESNITNPKLLDQFREARTKMAKTYAYEGATDLNTGMVDVKKLSRITAKDGNLTGDIASLGRVAGNFPDAFTAKATTAKEVGSHLGRTGLSGSLGGSIGYLFGGYPGAVAGGVLGAAAGEGVQALAGRRLASPEYQRSLSLLDRRIPAEQVAQVIQAMPRSQSIVPYQAPVEVLDRGEGPYRPNFVMQGEQYGPRVTPSMPPQQGLLSAPSAQGTLGALRAEDVRRAGVSRAVGQQAEAQQAAMEAASRRPARGEVILDIDPITGELKPSQGIKGATPETFSNFGLSLETAAAKVTSGKKFDLTAAEKVAWERTRVDLSEVAPGFKALSDKAIAEKMLDREWVAKTAQKAREKAKAFDEQARQASNMRAMQEALIKREKMLDIAADMEESLRAPRPDTSRKQQGPKTRAAFREGLFSGKE
jgi:hypothetical protein